jgi:regulator of vacuolar morphogenesis
MIQDKEALIGNKPKVGRILGKETDKTRELDNQGVLQLQKQIMENQDLGIDELRKIVARQKELGIAIHNELQIQNEMLNMVDEDVDRVKRKVDIGKRRVGAIS